MTALRAMLWLTEKMKKYSTGCIKKNWTNLKSLSGFVKRRIVRSFLVK